MNWRGAFLLQAWSDFSGGSRPRKTHLAFVRFLQLSKIRKDWKKRLGYEGNSAAYSSYVDSLLPFAEKIEKLAPAGHLNKVNPEYPWIDDDGEVICPAEYDFRDFKKTDLVEIQKLIFDLSRTQGFR